MLRNDLKIIIRNLRRNKFFAFINVAGLAIGLGITLYIGLLIINELSFENMHSKADQIYRVTMHVQDNSYDVHWARLNRDWVNNLPADIPEVEYMVRFQDYYPRFVQVGNENYKVGHAYSVDSDVFEVFDFELLQGNPKSALLKPNSAVLTEKMVRNFFSDQDPIGKEISIIDATGSIEEIYTVTGIMKDLPSNTHLPVNILTSFSSEQERTGWAYSYILLQKDSDLTAVEAKISEFISSRATQEDVTTVKLPLQSLESIHLNSDLAREIKLNGKKSHLWLLTAVGMIVLIMSTINFVNLNAAQSLRRLPEIGLRKVLGSARKNLISYFFIESCLLCFISFIMAIALVVLFINLFQEFAPISVTGAKIIIIGGAVTVMVSILAGIFPALILTSQPIVSSIKGKVTIDSSRNSMTTKNLLVALQLILCIALISSTLITRSQFKYLSEKNLRLDKEQLLAILDLPNPVKDKYDLFKNQIEQLSFVQGVTASMEVPSREIRDSGPIYAEGAIFDTPPVMDVQLVDEDFIEVMKIKLLAGRNFQKLDTNDSLMKDDPMNYLQSQPREYIINESALDLVGWESPDEALGKEFSWSISGIQLKRGPVVGVVEDFHQESLRNRIEPLVMTVEPYWFRNILIKLSTQDMLGQVSMIQDIWDQNFTEFPMDYAFVNDLYQKIYQNEQKQLGLIYIFSGLAILIAFIGILGLFAYALRTREKELAIRKVLGASLSSITLLLSKHLLYLALVGVCVALPLTWFVMTHWLENFVYHIDINLLYFVLAIGITILTLLITVSLQIRTIEQNNPANILRSD